MRVVSRFESDLLMILRWILQGGPEEPAMARLLRPQPAPQGLRRDAIDLVQQTLSAGVVMRLTRDGGWRNRRHLRDGQPVEGSLWQRTSPDQLGLRFSASTLDLLIWLTQSDGLGGLPVWRPTTEHAADITIADQLLHHYLAHGLAERSITTEWFSEPLFARNGLIALMHPEQFVSVNDKLRPEMDRWISNDTQHLGSVILEAMQDVLADQWVHLVQRKSLVTAPDATRRIGECEDQVLQSFLVVAREQNRPDLCRFVLTAANRLLTDSTSLRQWLRSIEIRKLKMDERVAVYLSGGAILRAVRELSRWHRETSTVHFFDEGYPESQFLKSMWENMHGHRLSEQAERMLDELEF